MADLSVQANELITIITPVTALYFYPDEIRELSDDTSFESPYNEIESFIMRR